MSSLRISYICTDRGIPVDGPKGASVHFRELGHALRRQGATVRAVARRRDPTVELPFPVVEPERARPAPKTTSPVVRELESLCDQRAVFAATDLLDAPDAVYERFSLFGFAGLRHARQHRVPLLLEVNAPLWEEAARFRGLQFTELARTASLALMAEADQVLTVSPRLRELLIEAGLSEDSVTVLANGVSRRFLPPLPPIEPPVALAGRPIVAFVGSLKPWHGVEFLLDAMLDPRSSRLGLWVIGDGPLRDRVKSAAARHPDRIHFEGAVEHERIPSILATVDVAVAPYLEESPDYFCPLKVVEALCAGVPLVASRVRAVTDIVPDPELVHWFDPGRVESFHRAVGEALMSGRELRSSNFHPRDHTWDARAQDILTRIELQRRALQEAG